jgi:hypothetical protein
MFSVDAGALAGRKKKGKKEEVKDDGAGGSGGDGASAAAAGGSNVTPAQLRIAKDLADLELPSNVEMHKLDDYNLSFTISPDTGHWKGAQFEFRFTFPSKYPFVGPKGQTQKNRTEQQREQRREEWGAERTLRSLGF